MEDEKQGDEFVEDSFLPKPEEVPEEIRNSVMTDKELDQRFTLMQKMLRSHANGKKGVEPLVMVLLQADIVEKLDTEKVHAAIAEQANIPVDEVALMLKAGDAYIRPQIQFTLDCEPDTKVAFMYANGKEMGLRNMQPICVMVAGEIWMSRPDTDTGKTFAGMPRDNPDRVEGLSLIAMMIDGRPRVAFTAIDRDPEGMMIVNQPWVGLEEAHKARPLILENFYKGFMHGVALRMGGADAE